MTNFERYREEILEVTNNGNCFALVNDKVKKCSSVKCSKCLFNQNPKNVGCQTKTIKWLYEEYKPKPTRAEKFMELIKGTEFEKYFAVNINGNVHACDSFLTLEKRQRYWNAESESEDK